MLRETISMWNESVVAYDKGNYEEALRILSTISEPTAKILFDIGCIHLNTGSPNKAFEVFEKTVVKDEHLSVGHFQRGVAALKVNRVSVASESFTKSYFYLRGNNVIDYRQLGLPILLCKSQVLINIAVCLFRQNKKSSAVKCLTDAMGLKNPSTLQSALRQARDNAQNNKEFPMQELPVSAIFRPAKSIVSNLEKKDFLGKAEVIASIDENDTFTGFVGPKTKHSREGNISPSSPLTNEIRHAKSLEDLSRPHSPVAFLKYRPPPPHGPPPRLPNRKIVCVQKSHSMESMLDKDELSPLNSLKMANNFKTGTSNLIPTVSELKELGSKSKNRSEAPRRPPPVYRPKTQHRTTLKDQQNQDSKNMLPSTLADHGKFVNTRETIENNTKTTAKVLFEVPKSRQLKPPNYPPPKRENLGNGHSNSGKKSSSKTMVAIYSFVPTETDQLSFMEGEIISVDENVDENWFRGRLRGQPGLVPWSYVQPFVRKATFR